MKQFIYRLLTHSRLFSYFLSLCIVLSIIELGAETIETVKEKYGIQLLLLNIAFILSFNIEYIARVWIADKVYPELTPRKARIKFMKSTNGIIDLLAFLPFYLPLFIELDAHAWNFLSMIRLLRIFKLLRFTNAFYIIGQIISHKKKELMMTVFITGILIIFSAFAVFFVENRVQPEAFDNIFSSLWWAVSAYTTVGYGDIYPMTNAGRLIGSFIAMLGITLIALPTGIISSGFVEQFEKEKAEQNNHIHKLEELNQMLEQNLITKEEYKGLREKILERFTS